MAVHYLFFPGFRQHLLRVLFHRFAQSLQCICRLVWNSRGERWEVRTKEEHRHKGERRFSGSDGLKGFYDGVMIIIEGAEVVRKAPVAYAVESEGKFVRRHV